LAEHIELTTIGFRRKLFSFKNKVSKVKILFLINETVKTLLLLTFNLLEKEKNQKRTKNNYFYCSILKRQTVNISEHINISNKLFELHKTIIAVCKFIANDTHSDKIAEVENPNFSCHRYRQSNHKIEFPLSRLLIRKKNNKNILSVTRALNMGLRVGLNDSFRRNNFL
jgi:hypothetical protein